jgi:hypothetical protein
MEMVAGSPLSSYVDVNLTSDKNNEIPQFHTIAAADGPEGALLMHCCCWRG